MRTSILCLALLAAASPARAQPKPTARAMPAKAALVSSTPFTWPAYDALSGRDKWSITAAAYAKVTGPAGLDVQRIQFKSGGFTVGGYLARPARKPGVRHPVVIWCKGGGGEESAMSDKNVETIFDIAMLARAGFVVLAPQYRGIGGSGGVDELGGAEVADVHALGAIARNMPDVDPARLFVYGISRGSLDALIAVREGLSVRAVAVTGAVVDWRRTQGDPLFANPPPGVDWRSAKAIERRSPVEWAAKLSVPILILQGGADRVTPPEDAMRLASVLEKAGAVYELGIIAGGDHGLARQRETRMARVVDWFSQPRKQNVAVVVERALDEGGAALAKQRFAAARGTPDRFDLVELDLNVLGYVLIGRQRVADAVTVFELNAAAFPRSANVWDSLGEAQALKGDKAAAIASYKKALALDPAMPSAKAALTKLGAK